MICIVRQQPGSKSVCGSPAVARRGRAATLANTPIDLRLAGCCSGDDHFLNLCYKGSS